MAANGKVLIGFSKPYVALYSATGTTVNYTSGQILARGVSVDISAETADSNDFYADNIIAESESGVFSSGTATLTVDGLFQDAEKLIMGVPAASTDGFIHYGDDQKVPDVGVGFIVKYQSDGVETYTPIILPRGAFDQISLSAETQGETKDWQTQDLTFNIKRAEDANRNWKLVGGEMETESAAESAIKTYFKISAKSS